MADDASHPPEWCIMVAHLDFGAPECCGMIGAKPRPQSDLTDLVCNEC